jgi:hypothetical protein
LFVSFMVWRRLAAPAIAALAMACASPTLPLPPPDEVSIAQGLDTAHVRLSGKCGSALASAVIVIINENPSVAPDLAVSGALTTNCGAWDASVFAQTGDWLEVTQTLNGATSIPKDLRVP